MTNACPQCQSLDRAFDDSYGTLCLGCGIIVDGPIYEHTSTPRNGQSQSKGVFISCQFPTSQLSTSANASQFRLATIDYQLRYCLRVHASIVTSLRHVCSQLCLSPYYWWQQSIFGIAHAYMNDTADAYFTSTQLLASEIPQGPEAETTEETSRTISTTVSRPSNPKSSMKTNGTIDMLFPVGGERGRHLLIACLWLVCRMQRQTFNLQYICETAQISESSVRKFASQIRVKLRLAIPEVDLATLSDRYLKELMKDLLPIPQPIESRRKALLQLLRSFNVATDKSPFSLAGAIAYFVLKHSTAPDESTWSQCLTVSNSSEWALNQRMKEFETFISQVVDSCFPWLHNSSSKKRKRADRMLLPSTTINYVLDNAEMTVRLFSHDSRKLQNHT